MKKRFGGKFALLLVAAALFVSSSIYAANIILSNPGSNATGNGSAVSVIDVFTSGSNTSHSQIVELQGIEDVYVSFHCPVNGVTVGTVTFGLEESMDGVTFGSITASQMTRSTNTLQTNATVGSTTGFWYAGEYRGTHTSSFVGTLGTSTALTNQFYHIKPYGAFLRFLADLTSSGTDTSKHKVIIRKGGNMNKF